MLALNLSEESLHFGLDSVIDANGDPYAAFCGYLLGSFFYRFGSPVV
jgi:hypothetical protein